MKQDLYQLERTCFTSIRIKTQRSVFAEFGFDEIKHRRLTNENVLSKQNCIHNHIEHEYTRYFKYIHFTVLRNNHIGHEFILSVYILHSFEKE